MNNDSKTGGADQSATWVEHPSEVERLRADLAAAQTRIAALTALIERVEWGNGLNFVCPWCLGKRLYGHKPDRPRQAALGLNHDAEAKP